VNMHRKPNRVGERLMVTMGWAIAVALVAFAVPSATAVILLRGLWRKMAIAGYPTAIVMFLRQVGTRGSDWS
jgi:hypothetical protein